MGHFRIDLPWLPFFLSISHISYSSMCSNFALYSWYCEWYIVESLDSVIFLQRVLIFIFLDGQLTWLKPYISCRRYQLKSLFNYLILTRYLCCPWEAQGTKRDLEKTYIYSIWCSFTVALSFAGCLLSFSGCYRNPKLFLLQDSEMAGFCPRCGTD